MIPTKQDIETLGLEHFSYDHSVDGNASYLHDDDDDDVQEIPHASTIPKPPPFAILMFRADHSYH